MSKQKRNRNTYKLSEKGLSIVRQALKRKGLTQWGWAYRAELSTSTAKRLLYGEAIDPSNFYALLQSLELDVKEDYIAKKIEPTKTLVLPTRGEITTSKSQNGVFMTGTFTEDKRFYIERMLRHLQSLLIGGKVKFKEDKGVVTVSGNFSEENKIHIEETIEELEEHFSTLKVTW